ncbi:hypothetical protein D3C75_1172990 [compost metagenome]
MASKFEGERGGVKLQKLDYEIATELTQEYIRAKGVALSGGDTTSAAVKSVLSAEDVASAFKTILSAVREEMKEY